MGKPLIGDGQMLAMHSTMLHLRTLLPSAAAVNAVTSRAVGCAGAAVAPALPDVALLAATLLQLRPGDMLITGDDAPLAGEVLRLAQESTFSPDHTAAHLTVAPCSQVSFAAGHAFAHMHATRPGDDAPVTVALLERDAVTTAAFAETMHLASDNVLPLLLIVQDGPAASAARIASIPNVEVVRIDASDAVACCRVMQESLLRTRNRWGSVVLHAVHLPNEVDPVLAFEAHLRRRGLEF